MLYYRTLSKLYIIDQNNVLQYIFLYSPYILLLTLSLYNHIFWQVLVYFEVIFVTIKTNNFKEIVQCMYACLDV